MPARSGTDKEEFKSLGWLMVVIGLAIRYAVSRRRFYRRGIGGLQHFSSFGKGMFVSVVEMVFSLLSFLILWGGVLMLGYYYSLRYFEKKERERKAQETELVYNGFLEGMLPLPHTLEQTAWTGLRFSHLPENPFSVKGIFGNRL